MKNLKSKPLKAKAVAVVLLAATLAYVVIQTFGAVGPATLYTSPGGTQSAALNSNFTVNVRISTAPDVSVTGAQVVLAYPADKVQVVSVGYSGSPYNTHLEETNSAGALKIVRAAFPKIPGGDHLFAQVQFKAIAPGAAGINFTSNSYVTSGDADSDLPLTRQGVTYNIPAPATPPPPPAAPTPSPTPPPPAPAASQPPAASPAPSPAGITRPTTTSTVTSRQPAPAASPVPTNVTGVLPGQKPADQLAIYQLEFIITNGKQRALRNAEIIIGEKSVKTDYRGKAVFQAISAGEHLVTIRHQGKDTVASVTVAPGDPATAQVFNMVAGDSSDALPAVILKGFIILLLTLVGLAGSLAGVRYLRNRQLSKAPELTPMVTPPEVKAPKDTPIMNAIEAGSAITPGMVFTPPASSDSTPESKKDS